MASVTGQLTGPRLQWAGLVAFAQSADDGEARSPSSTTGTYFACPRSGFMAAVSLMTCW